MFFDPGSHSGTDGYLNYLMSGGDNDYSGSENHGGNGQFWSRLGWGIIILAVLLKILAQFME